MKTIGLPNFARLVRDFECLKLSLTNKAAKTVNVSLKN